MIAALLILIVGLADIVVELLQQLARPQRAARRAQVTTAVVGAAAVVVGLVLVAGLGFGLPVGATIGLAAFGLAWVGAASLARWLNRNIPLLSASLLLVVAIIVSLASGRSLDLDGPLMASLTAASTATGFDYPLQVAIGAVGIVLFLTQSMNNICKAALGRALATDEAADAETPNRWALLFRGRTVATLEKSADLSRAGAGGASPSTTTRLRGGRVIGPIERLSIAVLSLFGAQAVIVGLLAAKGIVRFPEIAADGRGGSRAEEFLVGSLVSWSSAGLAALFFLVLQNS